MGAAVPYALTAHHFIHEVGDYAGFAAFVGIALLVIVLFVHARENAELRARAEAAEDRLNRLEAQSEQMLRAQAAPGRTAAALGRVGPEPAPPPASALAPAGAPPPAAAPAAAQAAAPPPVAPRPALAEVDSAELLPAAPFGVAGPALASATRLIPMPDPPVADPPPSAAVVAAPAPAAPPAATSSVAIAAPPPATAAAGATPAPPAPAAPPPPLQGPRRDYGRPTEDHGSRVGRASIAVVGVLVAIIVVAVVLIVNHGGSHSHHASAAANRTSGRKRGRSAAGARGATTVHVDPSTVTVAVLNGTSTTDLAHDVSSKLAQDNFQPGATGNATETLTRTIVGYLPGRRTDALAVAEKLDLSPKLVKAVSPADRAVACAGAITGCPDQVVVTVGSDLASDA